MEWTSERIAVWQRAHMLSWGALSKAMWIRQRGDRAVPNRRKFHPGEISFYYYLEKNRKIGRLEIVNFL